MDPVVEVRSVAVNPNSLPKIVGMISRGMTGLPEEKRGFMCFPYDVKKSYSLNLRSLQLCNVMKTGSVIVAGGSVLSCIENSRSITVSVENGNQKFISSDIDLFIRANSPEESRAIVDRLMVELKPIGVITRSRFALSYYTEPGLSMYYFRTVSTYKIEGRDCVKIQIIDRPIPRTDDIKQDIAHLFKTFDLECCKWATDGNMFYSTPMAIKCLSTRICQVPFDKISDAAISRMARYYLRCYDFEVIDSFGEVTKYPNAVAKILECIGDERARSNMPNSSYETLSLDHASPMTQMFKNFGVLNMSPIAICGTSEDLRHIIDVGTQTDRYLEEWEMEILGVMSENVTWMACDSLSDRSMVQDCCVRSVQKWKRVCRETPSLGSMFSHPPNFVRLSEECRQRYWQAGSSSSSSSEDQVMKD